MLFYASEKYPEEDGYSKYITEVYLLFCCQTLFLFLQYIQFKIIKCFIIFVHYFFASMGGPLMLVQVLREPNFILMSMLTILKRPWTGDVSFCFLI